MLLSRGRSPQKKDCRHELEPNRKEAAKGGMEKRRELQMHDCGWMEERLCLPIKVKLNSSGLKQYRFKRRGGEGPGGQRKGGREEDSPRVKHGNLWKRAQKGCKRGMPRWTTSTSLRRRRDRGSGEILGEGGEGGGEAKIGCQGWRKARRSNGPVKHRRDLSQHTRVRLVHGPMTEKQ